MTHASIDGKTNDRAQGGPARPGRDALLTIDVWAQHPSPEFWQHPMFASLRRWTGQDKLPDGLPVSATLAAMDEAGVARSLLSAWSGPEGVHISNESVAELVRAHPDRFSGVASVDIRRPTEAVRELRHCVRDEGFVGLRLLPWLWRLPPNHRLYYPLLTECVELGVAFCLQVGHAGPLMPSEPGRPIPYLDDVALDFPDLKIVGGHIGYPWTDEMIALATKYENVYIDTSAYLPKRYPPQLVSFLRGHGRHKVLFGSNYPMLSPARCLAELDALSLDDEARRLFLRDNAVRVFGLPA